MHDAALVTGATPQNHPVTPRSTAHWVVPARREEPDTGPAEPAHDVLFRLLDAAADSVLVRRRRTGRNSGRVRVTSVLGRDALVVADDGPGLDPAQVRALLTASVSGVDALEALAGITGLDEDATDLAALVRSCLLVGEDVEVRSRPAGHPDAATLRVTIGADGRARLSLKGVTAQRSGTEIRVEVDRAHRDALGPDRLPDVVAAHVAGWTVPVEVDGVLVDDAPAEDEPVEDPSDTFDLDAFLTASARSAPTPPSRYGALLGAKPVAVLPLPPAPGGLTGTAVFLPAGAVPEHLVELSGRRVTALPSALVPAWLTACAIVVDLTTAGGGGEDAVVREHVGRAVHEALLRLADEDPPTLGAIVREHPTALDDIATALGV